MKRLEGKPVAQSISERIKQQVELLKAHHSVPCLATLRLGNNPDDAYYSSMIEKKAAQLGISVVSHILDAHASQDEVLGLLQNINADANIHGCLLFRPLPNHLDEQLICNALDPAKDIDGITDGSLAGILTQTKLGYPPATAEACLELLRYYGYELSGAHALVVGRSLVVGKPVSLMLQNCNATVTMAHSRTRNLAHLAQEADIVIYATGRPRAFGAAYGAPGQVVVDVGINFDEEGTLCGDAHYDELAPLVSAITPVPGGIGSVTTMLSLEHVVQSALAAHHIQKGA